MIGWIIVGILSIICIFSFLGGGYILSPWYNTLSEEEKETYSKSKVSVNMGISLLIFTAMLSLFLWFLNCSFSDTVKITVSLIFFVFIIFYVIALHKKGIKNCKR